jgi:tetratricopeptide (TPR) repeat protein
MHLANFLFAENRVREAQAVAQQVIALDPSNTRAHWVIVDALWRQDRYNESFRTLEAAIERFPTDIFLLQQLARLSSAASREDAVPIAYRRAIGLAEMPRGIWEVLIRALIKQEEFEEAADTARRAMLLYPAASEFGALLAEILLRNGTGLEAITQDIASVLGQESHALSVQIALISGLLSQQKWDEATSLLEELRADTADQPELMLGLGIALTGKGAHDDAVAILSALAEKQPDNLQTWEALCDAHREAKHIKGAVAAYRRLEALAAPLHMMRRVQIKLFGEQVA